MKKFLLENKYPLLFSITAFFLLIVFYPFQFHRSHHLVLTQDFSNSFEYKYNDLDGDGEAELLMAGYNSLNDHTMPFIRICSGIDAHADVLEQINLRHPKLPWKVTTFTGDYDADGLGELYTFTLEDSSLYLEAFEYHPDPQEIELFIDREIGHVHTYKGRYDVNIPDQYEFIDLDMDGFKELVFIVNGLYTAEPRGLYVYDIRKDSLRHTATQSIHFSEFNSLAYNGKTYFGAHTGTVHNTKPPLPALHDHCGWAILLDHDLNMVFPPDSNRHGYHYEVNSYPVWWENNIHLLSFFMTPASSGQDGEIRLYDEHGRIIRKQKLEIPGRFYFYRPGRTADTIIINNAGRSWQCILGTDIRITDHHSRGTRHLALQDVSFQIDGNDFSLRQLPGNDKIMLVNGREKIISEIAIPDNSGRYALSFGKVHGRDVFAVSNYFRTGFYEVVDNPLHAYRYLLWSALFVGLFFFFWSMRLAFTYQLRRQQAIREALMKGQLAISKRQLEPHFMLNMLNNIGYLFSQKETKEAQYYFGKYASLLHRGLRYADRVETSLQEELEFIRDYLELQKMRFTGELEYSIEIHDDIDPGEINIPHSLLFTFVENAIKHGLVPKDDDRKLWVKISRGKRHYQIKIIDNGIGRAASRKMETRGSGKGLEIVNSIIDAYNKLQNAKITYQFVVPEEFATGTEVIILLPV